MTATSHADYTAREALRVRGDVRRALREVYAGADLDDVDALLDQLDAVDLKVVRR